MTHGNQYLGKLYNDLITNSPQTISMDIPSDMDKGELLKLKLSMESFFPIGKCAINRT